MEGKYGWITRIIEYDVEIKTTKLIRGRFLCENIAEETHMISFIKDNEHANEESDWLKQYIIYFRTR